ncbi:MAG: hypothetical protein H6686_07975 [Fibrobacteria bacterium]|nr:hypothetical protein [Fibrobacteria bacterium]
MKQAVEKQKVAGRIFATVAALSTLLSGTAFGWSVSGTVKSKSGSALSGVEVTVKDSSAYKTTTDNNGNFKLQSPTSIDHGSLQGRTTGAWIDGQDLVVQGMPDGPLGLSLVNASGRSIWNADVASLDGSARSALPSHLVRGAIFLRIKHARGTSFEAVRMGSEGLTIGTSPSAARALAGYPVLQFKLSGYNDTTYNMNSDAVSGITVTMAPPATCELGTTFKWKDFGKPIAEPKNGWLAIKDFTMVRYNDQYLVYMTYTPPEGGFKAAYMAPFADFSQANSAAQKVMPNNLPGVAPELIYFTPKKQWVFTTQWCGGGFCYTTGSDATNPSTFNRTTQSLLSENITNVGNPLEGNKGSDTGPIDQVVICDDNNCYLFYNDDNGRVYRASMPKSNFPGKFSGSKMIIQDTKTRLFEAIEVYKLKGQKKYLMIVECAWTRYFRAFTATDLGGTWTPLGNTREEATPFAGARNVTGGWSTDISHGEIVRTGYDEYREIDPCNLQMIYQGKNGGGDYNKLPYRMGLLTRIP